MAKGRCVQTASIQILTRLFLTSVFLSVFLVSVLPAENIYISPPQETSGQNSQPGLNFSGTVMYPNIQAAIDDACDGDTIYLYQGRYFGPGNRDLDFKGKAITLSGMNPDDPAIVAATIIDCNGTQTEPHRGFYFHTGEDNNSIVSGLTIKNGWPQYSGGGIYCEKSSPKISYCNITGCSANSGGSAFYSNYGSPVLIDCNIFENKITDAVSFYTNSTKYPNDSNKVLIENCTIKNNPKNGIYCGGKADIINCRIEYNKSYGVMSRMGPANIHNCKITANGTIGNINTGGISSMNSGNYGIKIDNSEIIGNYGIGAERCDYIENCTVSYNLDKGLRFCGKIINCNIIGNGSDGIYYPYYNVDGIRSCRIAENKGNGIYYYSSNGIQKLTDCTITNNDANGVLVNTTLNISNCLITNNKGSGTYYNSGTQKLVNCTILGNKTNGVVRNSRAIVSIANCIVRDNIGQQITGLPLITYTNSYTDADTMWPEKIPYTGTGNVNCDPCFVSKSDFHLRSDSNCIDAGTNDIAFVTESNDIEGTPRILDGNGDGIAQADMGAYEYNPDLPLISAWADRALYLDNASPQPQNLLFIQNAGADILNYSIETDCNWLTIIPPQGISSGEIKQAEVLIDANNLEFGDYICTVKIYDPNAANNPLAVQLNVHIGNLWIVPTDFNTIQAAVNAAQSYDHICVLDGIYTGRGNADVNFIGKNLVLYSQNGPQNCVIEGNGISKGFKLTSGQTLETILDGFTVKKVSWVIYCKNSSSTIRNCIFTDADGVSFDECDTLSFKNCDINSAHNTIFGLNIDKLFVEDCNITGTLHIIYIGDCRFTKVKFWNNISSGSVKLEMAKNAQFTDSIISGNRKNTGLYFYQGQQLTVNNCLFTGHKWACESSANKADFTNCTFTQNYYPGGKTIQCNGSGINSQVNFTNCILWDDVNSIYISPQITANITYSDVRGGWAGLGNINCDPCFAELGYLDANGTPDNTFDDFWVDGDYHLKSEGWRWDARRSYWTYDRRTSRCIEAGSPGYSLGDEPLTVPPDPRNLWGENLRIDMGFYGGTAEASMPPYDWSLLSDIDNTGSVDFTDYAHIAADYGQENENLNGDLNRDGKITIDDIILLTDDWLLSTDWAGI